MEHRVGNERGSQRRLVVGVALGVAVLGALVLVLQTRDPGAALNTEPSSPVTPSVSQHELDGSRSASPKVGPAQPTPLSVSAASDLDPIERWAVFDAEPATLTGRLVDDAGSALANAEVIWLPDAKTGNVAQHASAGSLPRRMTRRTDSEGRFAFEVPWVRRELAALHDAERDAPRIVVGGDGFAWRAIHAGGFLGGSFDFGDIALRGGETGFRLEVVDPSGAPAVGVEVELSPNAGSHEELEQIAFVKEAWMREARLTDAQGRLEFGVPDASKVWLVFHSQDFPAQRVGEFALDRGEFVDLGQFTLRDGLTLAGHVRDASGAGIPGAQLKLANATFIIPPLERQGRVRIEWEGNTDAQGHFEVRGLPESEPDLVLSVSAPSFHALEKHPVSPGSQNLDLRLDSAPSLEVHVSSSTSGARLPHALILARALDEPPRSEPPGNGAGVPVPVLEGHVSRLGRHGGLIFVSAPGHLPQRIVIDASELDTGTLDVRLASGPDLCGTVTDVRGSPIDGATISFTLGSHSWVPERPSGFARHMVKADENGRFSAPSLPFGVWTPSVSHPRFSPRTLSAVNSAQPPECLQIALDASSRVQGVLLGAEGAPAAGRTLRFTFEPTSEPSDGGSALQAVSHVEGQKGTAVTDQLGRFAIEGLRSGEFRVESWPGLSTVIEVNDAELVEVELRCLPAARVFGEVAARGLPLPDVRLAARFEGEFFDSARNVAGRTDAFGRFDLELPAEGRYEVQLRTDTGVRHTREVNARFGDDQRLDFELAGGRLSGALLITDEGVSMPAGVSFELRRDDERVGTSEVALDGSFAIDPLEPGDYTLHLKHRLLPRVWWGPFTLGIGEQLDDLELEIGGAASLALTLRSPEGKLHEGFVTLIDPVSGAARVSDDVDWGGVSFDSLPPGDYRILHARYGWPFDGEKLLAPDAFDWPAGSLSTLHGSDLVTVRPFEERRLELVVSGGKN